MSCNEDGGDSGDSLAAESNAQPVQLVAQLAHVDARGVRGAFFSRVPVRACRLIARCAMTGTGH